MNIQWTWFPNLWAESNAWQIDMPLKSIIDWIWINVIIRDSYFSIFVLVPRYMKKESISQFISQIHYLMIWNDICLCLGISPFCMLILILILRIPWEFIEFNPTTCQTFVIDMSLEFITKLERLKIMLNSFQNYLDLLTNFVLFQWN